MYPIALAVLAVALAGTAATFSIAGLREFASGAPNSVTVLGGILEIAKLVIAAWLHSTWSTAPRILRWPGVVFVGAIMLLTMLGIFAFLWSAHGVKQGDRDVAIMKSEHLDRQVAGHRDILNRAQVELTNLNEEYRQLAAVGRVSKARTLRSADTGDLTRLQRVITDEQAAIDVLEAQRLTANVTMNAAKAEMGAAMALAGLFGGSETMAVNIFILLLMIPFDPLAVWLAVAASHAASSKEKIAVQAIKTQEASLQNQQASGLPDKSERSNGAWWTNWGNTETANASG